MIRIVTRTLAALLIGAVLLFPADWMVWRVRVAAGGGMGRVQISHVTVASLKGNKEEYYADGTEVVNCSLSIFPQAGAGACWWLRRHPEVADRF